MIFTLAFVSELCQMLLDGAPLFAALGVVIIILSLLIGRWEGWSTGDSLYYGFITATTVGYGDLTPTSARSKLVSVFLPFVGLIFTGIIVALSVEAATTTFDRLAASSVSQS